MAFPVLPAPSSVRQDEVPSGSPPLGSPSRFYLFLEEVGVDGWLRWPLVATVPLSIPVPSLDNAP